MKRLRDDFANSQFKRPFGSSRGESQGQPQVPAGGGGEGGGGSGNSTQKLTTSDALTYLKEVKDMFRDQRDKYDMFLDVMKDFKAQRIDTAGVIARVKELFKGHNNLIFGFNTFLPKGYEITVIDGEEAPVKREETPAKRTVEFEEAISFVNKIKKRFLNDDRVYKSFLHILNMYRKEHKGIAEVHHEVNALLEDHPDLLDEFTRFLPDTSAVTSTHHASLNRHSYQRFDERSSAMPASRQVQMEKQRGRKDRIIGPHTVRGLSVERPDMGDDKTMVKFHKELRKRAEKESRDRRNFDQDHKTEHDTNRDMNMPRLSERKKLARKVDDFEVHPVLASYDDKDNLRNIHSQEFTFCERVKERLRNPDDYQAFLKCLHIYSTEIITRKELQSLVGDLLGKHIDLMEGFNVFLERCESLDGFLAGVMDKKSLWNEGHASKSVKVEDKEREQRRETDAAKEKDRYKEKYWGKSIQELDLSNCQRCTPSYRLLPDDYSIPTVSQRSELGSQVLNDHWVSVTSGSEDYSFKHMRRNQYEESLFRCEDDRFELDMLLESVKSAAEHTEELLDRINDNSIKPENPFAIEEYFTALNLRCIERLYGDHGLDVLEILRRNPSHAVPIILTRLRQKQDEWTQCRSDFNKVWADVYAKNHYKSLDHRSFYFKQQDSKNLSTKALVAEIKEVKEKQQKEDDILFSVAAGNRHSTIPNFKFEFSDMDIHDDLYKLIKFSCEEICTTKDQLNKVLRLWTTFLEPLLGVPSRPNTSEGAEDAAASIDRSAKIAGTYVGESDISPEAILNSKQVKPICNGYENNATDKKDSSRASLVNGDCVAQEDVIRSEKELKSKAVEDKVYGSNETASSIERVTESGQSRDPGADNIMCSISMELKVHDATSSRPNNAAEDGHGHLLNTVKPSSEHGDVSASVPLANGALTEATKARRHNVDAVGPSKIEKEEGEFSPEDDFDEANFSAYGDGGLSINTKHIAENRHCEDGGENDADADDEDSENVSEAGDDDVSGSETAPNECSPEEHEEEDREHDELDGKVESEGEVEGTEDASFVGVDGAPSEQLLLTVKPLAKYVASELLVNNGRNDSRIFYGNDSFYVLFRLHQVLYDRLLSANMNVKSTEMKLKNNKDACAADLYSRFINSLYSLLDGSIDNAKFEDDCRAIIGNQSYMLFTLDKVIYKLVKQLQNVASDEMDNKLLQLYEYEKSRKSEKFVDSVYHENAHVLLHEENIYRLQSSSSPTCLSIQLIHDGNEKSEVVAVSVDPNFAEYLYNDFLSVVAGKKQSQIFMQRNKCKYKDLDEASAISTAMKGVCMVNGLECKMARNSSKISYVLDTEDFFFREKRQKRKVVEGISSCHYQSRVDRFHRILNSRKIILSPPRQEFAGTESS